MENGFCLIDAKKKQKKTCKSVRQLKNGWARIKRTANSLKKLITKNPPSCRVNKAHLDNNFQDNSDASEDSGIDMIEADSYNNNTRDSRFTAIGPDATYTNTRVSQPCPSSAPSEQRQLNVTYVKTVTSSKPTAVSEGRGTTNCPIIRIYENQTEVHPVTKSGDPTDTIENNTTVKPPQMPKPELYSSTEVFKDLDRRAMQMARRRCYDIEKVSLRLTQKCTNDLEKARVLFRWVVAKDLISRNSKILNWTVSTVGDVSDLKNNREMFHRLYQTMCQNVGLRCEIIQGYSKGSGYKPGMRISGETFRNCWTAVAIDNKWRLVNCTWAARHMTSTTLNSCDEFYFLTDPQEHIFQHFPDEARWQLLEEPLPFREFTKLPLVKSPFFNNSLRFQTTYTSQVNSTDGKAQIKLFVPQGVKLASRLQASRSNQHSHHDVGVSRLTSQNEAVFTVHSSRPGRYYLSIYATNNIDEKCLESACMFTVNITDFNSQQL